MKTSAISPIRISPELRVAAESVLEHGESVSSLVAHALRAEIEQRKAQRDFVSRGLSARDESRRTGEYYLADDVIAELEQRLSEWESRQRF